MHPIFFLAPLLLSTIAEAHLGLSPRNDTEACCPCSGRVQTVTITATIAQTSTAPAPVTVYVTQQPETITITQHVPAQLQKQASLLHGEAGPATVTVNVVPAVKFVTVQVEDLAENVSPVEAAAALATPQSTPEDAPQAAVIKTVTADTNQKFADFTPPAVTVTAAPVAEPAVTTVEAYITVTHTVTSGNGDNNVEITIINSSNGNTSCVVEGSDLPCEGDEADVAAEAIELECPPFPMTTSLATAFNTILSTAGGSTRALAARAACSPAPSSVVSKRMSRAARVPRAPMTLLW